MLPACRIKQLPVYRKWEAYATQTTGQPWILRRLPDRGKAALGRAAGCCFTTRTLQENPWPWALFAPTLQTSGVESPILGETNPTLCSISAQNGESTFSFAVEGTDVLYV